MVPICTKFKFHGLQMRSNAHFARSLSNDATSVWICRTFTQDIIISNTPYIGQGKWN